MSEEAPAAKATILIYSDDRRTRDQIKVALGRRVAADVPELTMVECATHQAAIKTLDEGGIDLVIADGEAVPLGGMGLCRPAKDEVPGCPPFLLLVERVADAWLATWSRADAVVPYPIDPVRLPTPVAELLRERLGKQAHVS